MSESKEERIKAFNEKHEDQEHYLPGLLEVDDWLILWNRIKLDRKSIPNLIAALTEAKEIMEQDD